MSPSTQMEQDEDYKNAVAVLKELEKYVMDDNMLAKEQADVIKTIEVEIDKCIQSLIARKEALIKSVTDQFKEKRELMTVTQKQIRTVIESCKKLLDAGTTMFELNADVAKKTFKSTTELKEKNAQITPTSIVVEFTPLKAEQFGSVITSGLDLIERAGQPLSSWLSNKKFNLIYKGSVDGFKPADFHKICDNKGPTLTIIRSHPHNYLFGGYTSQSWDAKLKGTSINDPNAFIFTLTNPHGIPPTKYSVSNPASAIYSGPSHNVNFGSCNIGVYGDNQGSTQHFPGNYADTTGKGNITFTGQPFFTPNEIEVYTVA